MYQFFNLRPTTSMSEHQAKVNLLCEAVANSLALTPESVSADDTFMSLGGDSLAALYVVEAMTEKGFALDPIALLNDDKIGSVAFLLRGL
jgi:hypothetical protein